MQCERFKGDGHQDCWPILLQEKFKIIVQYTICVTTPLQGDFHEVIIIIYW